MWEYAPPGEKNMRIFYAFLVIVGSTILFLLPLTDAVYDFRTEPRNDSYNYETANLTLDNVTLTQPLFNNDIASINITSNITADFPLAVSYNATSNVTWMLFMSGLATNSSRFLVIEYDIDALSSSTAISNILDRLPMIWMLAIIAFAPAALFAIFTGRL